ncbi:aminotransferase class V-fold PLP-dependent enzyme [uncultured Anaerococcus sp.]|uniref:threonine aldolase family protein n=1 Tax=uncultured Anaerococcus sp. TaxID=293428 RepID=UPI00288B7932|nr:aminotransferase class V-fold PLP-dependent enzyme [uncultured Anaerococcus sp.]
MYFFVNDYNSICYPHILDALKEAIDEKNPGYGTDPHSENVRKLIKKALGDENVDIYFLPGGTGANIIGAAAGMRQQDSILSANTGHIEWHEAGSIEATGLKIELIDTEDGKLSRESIENFHQKFTTEYMTVPKKVYISNTTEVGTLYKKKELEEIYNYCKENGLYLFIDGARMAAALASEDCDYDLKDLTKLCDIFYLGGTKAGLLFGEALIVVNDELKKDMNNLIKQKGTMLAKGFISGIMWETVFKDKDFYIKGSKKAYQMAKILTNDLLKKGYDLAYPFESNQIFVLLDEKTLEKWQKVAKFEITGQKDGKKIVRLVTTFRTKEEEIKGFLEEI